MNFNIFIPIKKGHYRDYAEFLKSLLLPENSFFCSSFVEKIKVIFSLNPVIFLDIDSKDILWVLLRAPFCSNSFAVSVSGEKLLYNHFSFKIWDSKKLRTSKFFLRYKVLLFLKKIKRLKLISIHKGTKFENDISKIASLVTYDFQYYDLPYLSIKNQAPKELSDFPISDKQMVLIFNNTSAEKKNLPELRNWILNSKDFKFIVVGNIEFLGNYEASNVISIQRYVNNDELIYLMNFCDYIYCYYANERPSGFMGRAMQLDKNVIVQENSYLASIKYGKSIKVNELNDLVLRERGNKPFDTEKFNLSTTLKAYLLRGLQ